MVRVVKDGSHEMLADCLTEKLLEADPGPLVEDDKEIPLMAPCISRPSTTVACLVVSARDEFTEWLPNDNRMLTPQLPAGCARDAQSRSDAHPQRKTACPWQKFTNDLLTATT